MLLFNHDSFRDIAWFCQISIHLMLLFNRTWTIWQITDWYFNTSNVTIQHGAGACFQNAWKISIHLMLLFNVKHIKASMKLFYFNTSNVTIQLRKSDKISQFNFISIHLMLLFNSDNLLYYKLFYYISIHLMLLFNKFIARVATILEWFQYI